MRNSLSLVCAVLALSTPAGGQTIGTSKAPAELLKATLLLEAAETKTNTVYLPWAIYGQEKDRTIRLSPTNTVVPVDQVQTVFHPIGSGVLMSISNVNVFATAKHVVQANEDVFFRLPKRGGSTPDHVRHSDIRKVTELGWIYSTNSDLALTLILIHPESDVSYVPLDLVASFEAVSVGDEVYVSGFPASVIRVDVPVLRSGIISAKLADEMLLIEAFTFPGNSGGPVFWKPAMGVDLFGNKLGNSRPPCLLGLAVASSQYREEAISRQTGRPQVFFESNSGLTHVVSSSRILEMLDYPETKTAIGRALALSR